MVYGLRLAIDGEFDDFALVVDDLGLLFGLGVLFNFGLGKGWGVA